LVWFLKSILISCVLITASLSGAVEFKKKWILLGSNKIRVEIADSRAKRQKGLMDRTELKKNTGMLFIFENEKKLSFWMKNTYISLSIGYFNNQKTLVDIQKMQPVSMLQTKIPSYESKKPARYALEMNHGWFEKNKINIGAKFKFIKGNPKKIK
jgi:uncharacterized membrane protein (UPF0127 family)